MNYSKKSNFLYPSSFWLILVWNFQSESRSAKLRNTLQGIGSVCTCVLVQLPPIWNSLGENVTVLNQENGAKGTLPQTLGVDRWFSCQLIFLFHQLCPGTANFCQRMEADGALYLRKGAWTLDLLPFTWKNWSKLNHGGRSNQMFQRSAVPTSTAKQLASTSSLGSKDASLPAKPREKSSWWCSVHQNTAE